jgi:carboxymethylenebutenolidase
VTAPPPKFDRKEIGSANVQFPSGSVMLDPLDVAVDPYAPTKKAVGIKVKGFQAWPQKPGSYPAILILHERWGLTQHFQEMTYRLAQHGYVALAVDQYSRIGSMVTSDTSHAGQLMGKLNVSLLMQDLTAAVEYLNYQDYVKKHRIAVIGFDMGGTYALSFAAARRQLRVCVAFYGNIPLTHPSTHQVGAPRDSAAARSRPSGVEIDASLPVVEPLGALRCPVLYHQAEKDDIVTAQEVTTLAEKLTAQKVACEIHMYPGTKHGFFNNTRPEVYHAEAATEAWSRTLQFLDQYILAEHAGVRPLPDSQRKF